MDKVLGSYLIAGDDIFMLLHMLEGQTIHIPSKRKLNAANLHNVQFIEDDERYFADYEKGNILDWKDDEYTVVAKERKLLNHYYIAVVKNED